MPDQKEAYSISLVVFLEGKEAAKQLFQELADSCLKRKSTQFDIKIVQEEEAKLPAEKAEHVQSS